MDAFLVVISIDTKCSKLLKTSHYLYVTNKYLYSLFCSPMYSPNFISWSLSPSNCPGTQQISPTASPIYLPLSSIFNTGSAALPKSYFPNGSQHAQVCFPFPPNRFIIASAIPPISFATSLRETTHFKASLQASHSQQQLSTLSAQTALYDDEFRSSLVSWI